MKKSLLLTFAALTPLTLLAQNPATAPGEAAGTTEAVPTAATATSPGTVRLNEVQFEGEELKDVVQVLRLRAKNAGLDPALDPLNIVISPGLESRCVPALLLHNVSPTEVLSVATTVLGLRMEPVQGDDGRIVAWLIKAPLAQDDPSETVGGVGSAGAPSIPAPIDPEGATVAGAVIGAFVPSRVPSEVKDPTNATAGPGGGGGFNVPVPIAIASSPLPGGSAVVPARVFGIAPLLAVTDPGSDVGRNQRAEKFERLMITLEKLARDEGLKADIRAYNEMDIIVVKSPDPAALALIAEAIQAMKSNVDPVPTATGPQGH